MLILVLGLFVFLGIHCVRIVAPGWRDEKRQAWGEDRYTRLYTLISVAGLILISIGFVRSRYVPELIWNPPPIMILATAMLSWVSFVLIAASSNPNNRIKEAVRHPMSLGVAVWSLSHLLSNARLGDTLLFGSFLIWSLAAFVSAHRRDRAHAGADSTPEKACSGNIGRAIVSGTVVWAVFGLLLHRYVIGVHPFGWF